MLPALSLSLLLSVGPLRGRGACYCVCGVLGGGGDGPRGDGGVWGGRESDAGLKISHPLLLLSSALSPRPPRALSSTTTPHPPWPSPPAPPCAPCAAAPRCACAPRATASASTGRPRATSCEKEWRFPLVPPAPRMWTSPACGARVCGGGGAAGVRRGRRPRTQNRKPPSHAFRASLSPPFSACRPRSCPPTLPTWASR